MKMLHKYEGLQKINLNIQTLFAKSCCSFLSMLNIFGLILSIIPKTCGKYGWKIDVNATYQIPLLFEKWIWEKQRFANLSVLNSWLGRNATEHSQFLIIVKIGCVITLLAHLLVLLLKPSNLKHKTQTKQTNLFIQCLLNDSRKYSCRMQIFNVNYMKILFDKS